MAASGEFESVFEGSLEEGMVGVVQLVAIDADRFYPLHRLFPKVVPRVQRNNPLRIGSALILDKSLIG